MHLKVKKPVSALGYAVCGSTMLSALPAHAQGKPQTVDAIVIVDSNIKRIDAEGPLPIKVIIFRAANVVERLSKCGVRSVA